jgi:hypothetical protein
LISPSRTLRNYLLVGIIVNLFCCLPATSSASGVDESDMISFRISADKTQYHTGERPTVQFIIVNQGPLPLYVSRDLGTCSKWTGHTELSIRTSDNKQLPRRGCELNIAISGDADLGKIITTSDSWILLKPHDIYGTEESIDLPNRKGTFELVAELWPPGLSKEEIHSLAAEHIRVLQSRHAANHLTLMVR